tara:strand:+ start:72 stop:1142 length:1071 start_codon:yes stop_codon:yes gene_type:complete
MIIFLKVLFFSGLTLIVYTYVGYPLLLAFKREKFFHKDDTYEPHVSMIITAYNEERVIKSKLDNSLKLDYPEDKLEIILVSDGSNDETAEIAERFSRIRVKSLERRGKTSAQNSAVKDSSGDIIVFSDANNLFQKDAIRKIVRNFIDERVGVVCGELKYRNIQTSEGLYWAYEKFLKRGESQLGCLLGANGSIYALRKKDYKELETDAISDFIEPILIYGQGKDIIYEPEAIALEDEPQNIFSRKRRIILRSLVSLKYLKHLMNPLKNRNILFTLFSHKLLRWMMPLFLILLFIVNIFLVYHTLYRLIFIFQVIFYCSSILSKSVLYFIMVNAASLAALIDWCRGEKQITWEPDRT